MEFDDDDATQDSDELARQYVEVFRKYFGAIKRLEIETTGDRNFTKMIQIMIDDPTFPWFDSVNTVDVYMIRYLKYMELYKIFLTKFRALKRLNGIIEEEFNPLDVFIREGKRVNTICWTIPDKEDLRTKFFDFLQFNKTPDLRLVGGTLEKVTI